MAEAGVIGLGVIGYGIASNLRKKLPTADTLHVFDINAKAVEKLTQEFGSYGKIELATSPKDLASKCSTIISSLPAGPQVRQVYLDEATGVISASKNPDRLIIDCSTIEIEATKDIGTTIMKAGLGSFVDAPLSGGVWAATDGTLVFFIGHEKLTEGDVVGKKVYDFLSLVGSPDTHQWCGGFGMGQVAKIAHNYVSLCNNVVATEGMALGLKYGIDKKVLWNVMTNGTANSWVMTLEQPVPGIVPEAPSSKNYTRYFAPSLTLKDLGIAVKSARHVGLKPSVAEVAIEALKPVNEDPRTRDLDHTSLWLHVNGLVDEFEKNGTANM